MTHSTRRAFSLANLAALGKLAAAPFGGGGPEPLRPWIWQSEPPSHCPFEPSSDIVGIAFTGRHSEYTVADTWYPSWAADDRMYSPFTDGWCPRLDGGSDRSRSRPAQTATTGQAVIEGADPLNLKVYSLGVTAASASPYEGRYPCGSLVHDGVWYYGTYCLSPSANTRYGKVEYEFPWLGPLVGFRTSTDFGRTWKETPHTPDRSLFGETGMWGYPLKIGAPHFVDFGRNMEHSPDGLAYLTAHGASDPDVKPRFANLSWASGDEIYMVRVKPSVENINDPSRYEFFAGRDRQGQPQWSRKFDEIKPVIDWNNNTGPVTITYNAPLRRYLMCVTEGWPTYDRMNTYFLESSQLTGPWKLVAYLRSFGPQAYYSNFPSKFISKDGRTAWLCYSTTWKNLDAKPDPPGSRYALVLQEVNLLDRKSLDAYRGNPRP